MITEAETLRLADYWLEVTRFNSYQRQQFHKSGNCLKRIVAEIHDISKGLSVTEVPMSVLRLLCFAITGFLAVQRLINAITAAGAPACFTGSRLICELRISWKILSTVSPVIRFYPENKLH